MVQELNYPFDASMILKKKRSIKKTLISEETNRIKKKIAILGGETTENIKLMLELFLLQQGIEPEFYESEYNQWYEDGMFPNEVLENFAPDIIYVCTCIRSIMEFPVMQDSAESVQNKLDSMYQKFSNLWNTLFEKYNCSIIQNNFEYPFYRLLGNMDASDYRGRVNFVTRLNMKFYEYAGSHENFHICDVNYISATYGLEKWSNPYYWHMYKYAMDVQAIPYLSFNVANIIKSIYGKNKKVLNLDLDNTLWGGVIGDDGAENIEIGQETAIAQTYSEFQTYLKMHKDLGILLTINSKNDEDVALRGLERPDSVLKKDDFVTIKANWNPKSQNLQETAGKLNLLPESFVFVDDNPAERQIVADYISGVSVPEIGSPENYINVIDKSGFFEMTTISDDDLKRVQMYKNNAERKKLQESFVDYNDYLISLEMHAEIGSFIPMYMSRIAQLTNKSNQFNLTTKRYSLAGIEAVASDSSYITLYGKLADKFGDNGVVSVVIGKIGRENRDELHMELWIMSCRVLKRDMEFAMMDELAAEAKKRGIKKIIGYYYPTAKNAMVKDFYRLQGFTLVNEDADGNRVWELNLTEPYKKKQNVIMINEI